MDLILGIFLLLVAASVVAQIRMFWYGGLALKLDNQAEQREHELNVLKLQIELAKASTDHTLEASPCDSADS